MITIEDTKQSKTIEDDETISTIQFKDKNA